MKIEQLKKNGNGILPLSHGNAVYCNDGLNVSSHLEKLEDVVQPDGYMQGYEDIDYSSSLYWIDSTPRVNQCLGNQFGTAPIVLKNGETIEFECFCEGRQSALAKLTSADESASMTVQRLLVGTSVNNSGEVKKYTYTADADMYVKISCVYSGGLKVRINRPIKIADNAISYLEGMLDKPLGYVIDTGEITYQEIGKTDYAVIMMYGQSLSIGQESPAGFNDDPVDGCYMLRGGVHATKGDTLVPLNSGMMAKGDITYGNQDSIVSAVNAFVNLYHKAHPEDTNTKFIAVSLGVGGRSMVTFDEERYPWVQETYVDGVPQKKNNNMKDRVIPCLTALKAIADAEGKTISLCSLIWCQGETDYTSSYINDTYAQWYARHASNFGGSLDAYKQGLHDLYDDIYAHAQSIFGASNQVAPPPFFAYALGGKWIGNAFLTINRATYELADELETMWIIAPNYPVPDYNSGHLAMNGYRWYGEYIAKAMYYALIKKVEWTPLQPISVELVNGNIEVTFDRAVMFDTYTNDECPDYGFVIRQGTEAQLNAAKGSGATEYNVSITSITLSQDKKKITIVSSTALTADAIEVIYAGTAGSYSSQHFSGAGNVRDNDKWLALYNYKDDEGDHGNFVPTAAWSNVVASASDVQPFWDSATTYAYGDVVRYTKGSTTYKCTSLRDENNGIAPVTSDGTAGGKQAWTDDAIPYDDTLSLIDETVLAGNGYAFGAKANIKDISSPFGYRTLQSLSGGSSNGNKTYPYTKVDYKPEDANGNSIVGKKYPMQNWCINFYVRLENE